MCELEDFVGCEIKRNITKKTLKISQPYIITNMTQALNEDVNSQRISIPQLHHIRGLNEIDNMIYRRDTGLE